MVQSNIPPAFSKGMKSNIPGKNDDVKASRLAALKRRSKKLRSLSSKDKNA